MAEQSQVPKATPEGINAAQPAQRPNYRYVDLPELAESFADSIESAFFDGQSLRLEFCVTRLDASVQQTAPTGRRVPTCRLVLSPMAALDLMGRMQQISAAMIKAGVLKPAPAQTSPSPT